MWICLISATTPWASVHIRAPIISSAALYFQGVASQPRLYQFCFLRSHSHFSFMSQLSVTVACEVRKPSSGKALPDPFQLGQHSSSLSGCFSVTYYPQFLPPSRRHLAQCFCYLYVAAFSYTFPPFQPPSLADVPSEVYHLHSFTVSHSFWFPDWFLSSLQIR